MSAAVIILTLGYAVVGMHDVISRSDPKINQNIIYSYYGTQEPGFDITKVNKRFAISVIGSDY